MVQKNMAIAEAQMKIAENTKVSPNKRKEAFELSLFHAQKAFVLGSKEALHFVSSHLDRGLTAKPESS